MSNIYVTLSDMLNYTIVLISLVTLVIAIISNNKK